VFSSSVNTIFEGAEKALDLLSENEAQGWFKCGAYAQYKS
jgi:hypothetical protein